MKKSNGAGISSLWAIIVSFRVTAFKSRTETSVGKIIAPPPDIEIAWNDIIIKKERIYIDEYLLIGHMRTAKGVITSRTQEEGHHTHKHDIDDPYTETWILTDTLQVGDLVEVTPMKGDQLFIVKCKLIYLGNGDGYEVAKNAED